MMQFCLYVNMVFILTFSAYTIVTTQGLHFNVGQLSSLGLQLPDAHEPLMLSMVFVMIPAADESGHRIVEVLSGARSLTRRPRSTGQDGSIGFDGVSSLPKRPNAWRSSASTAHPRSGEP